MKSAPFAASFGDFVALKPSGTSLDIFFSTISKPDTRYPALISRVANGVPINPRPTTLTFLILIVFPSFS